MATKNATKARTATAPARTKTQPVVTDLTLVNETKGAVRYGEDTDNNPLYLLGTVYLRKAGLVSLGLGENGQYPKAIRVTVEAVS